MRTPAFYQPGFRLGILGGGQLGRMLIQEAINLNLSVAVLDPDPEAPCKELAGEFETGSLLDYDTVYRFGKNKNLLTIEIEHVNTDALEQLEKEGVKVYPQPHILRMVQDKGLQKEFYRQHDIPTADFFLIENRAALATYSDQLPFFQKMRKGGYDGKGVFRLDSTERFEEAFDVPSVLEKTIDFEKEISVLVSRNAQGETALFPVVECEFNPQANLVEFLFAPANLEAEISNRALDIARRVAEATGIVGLLAVEMFVEKDGTVLVNEIAPRPHNSGHHTIEANLSSQYGQHLRAILALPAGATDTVRPAVMVNLLGEEGHSGAALYEGLEEALAMPGVYVHLYGKKMTRPFRKMGHVTVTAATLEEAKQKAFTVKNILKVKSA